MIRIQTDGPQGAEYDRWRERADRAREKNLEEWRRNEPVNLREDLWKELKWIFLKAVFHDKCAYCEGNYCAGYAEHVEHYRPKKEITEARQTITHPGYFWLAYEWQNLLLACANCNSSHSSYQSGERVSHPGKLNEFRVTGGRVPEPSANPADWMTDLETENPLLLNPYFDDPEEHLTFDDKGFLYPKDGSERGKETIEVCDLNRVDLIDARTKGATEQVAARFLKDLMNPQPGKLFDVKDEFSAWLNHCVKLKADELSKRHRRQEDRV